MSGSYAHDRDQSGRLIRHLPLRLEPLRLVPPTPCDFQVPVTAGWRMLHLDMFVFKVNPGGGGETTENCSIHKVRLLSVMFRAAP